MIDAAFAALADPTRRHLFRTLAVGGPQTATGLAADLSISRQAVAKHLGILADAGMASSQRSGRETRYEAQVAALSDVQAWIRSVETEWTTRLNGLAAVVESQRPPT
jgi:DNA-binding transcriptional ArsR family regulator